MLKLFLHILLFALLFNSPSAYAKGNSVSHEKRNSATSILLFGDSIISGYGLAKLQKLDHKLEERLKDAGYNVDVINGGVSGDTTAGGRNRIKWALEKHRPNIIVIALGGNDFLRGFSPHVVKLNVEAMIKEARKYPVFIILSAVKVPITYGHKYQQSFNSIYPDLAKEYSLPLYPFLLHDVFYDNDLMQKDKIHPNADGVDKIARGLAEYFIKNIQRNQ